MMLKTSNDNKIAEVKTGNDGTLVCPAARLLKTAGFHSSCGFTSCIQQRGGNFGGCRAVRLVRIGE